MKIGEQVRNSVRGREAMAVSGRSPDQGICDAGACAVLQMHILSRNGHRETAKKPGGTPGIIKLD